MVKKRLVSNQEMTTMHTLCLLSHLLGGVAAITSNFNRNLVFRSPFLNEPQFAHHDMKMAVDHSNKRRDTIDASSFKNERYPEFYGSNLNTAPLIWSSGVNFTHSVASGDPFDTSVILWTRAVPLPSSSGQLPDQSTPICVTFKIGLKNDLSGKPADEGDIFTSYDVDFTAKVEAAKLQPDTKYFYQFADCANPDIVSPIGITRTLASRNTPAEKVNSGQPLTIAVFSCSQFQAGWFNAYGYAANNLTVDLFVHLGDYMYETVSGGGTIGRTLAGRVLATIQDYRRQLNQYRSDLDLQFAHQNAPWVTVWWDDHEIADNAWKAGTTTSNDSAAGCTFSPSGACFTDRKLAGVRAYHEWMPIRQVDARDQLRIWRNFQIGKLLDLSMLDTRQYDRDITDVGYNRLVASLVDDPLRSMMGANQEQWLYKTLSESQSRGTVWRVIGQQVVFSQRILSSGGTALDSWDGYRTNRNRILDHLYNNHIDNTIILAGDSHANWVSDLAHANDTNYDPVSGVGAIGVEFAVTGVTSTSGSFNTGAGGFEISTNNSRRFVSDNVDLQWSEGYYRGFFTLSLDAKTLNATYYSMRNVTFRNLDGFPIATFPVIAGGNHLARPVAGGEVLSGALKSQL